MKNKITTGLLEEPGKKRILSVHIETDKRTERIDFEFNKEWKQIDRLYYKKSINDRK